MQKSGHRTIGKSVNRALWTAVLSALLPFGPRVAWGQDAPPQQSKTVSAANTAPVGIPRDLARLRAQQLKDIRYQLSFTIRPKADFISGHEELRFVQNADARGILREWLDRQQWMRCRDRVKGRHSDTSNRSPDARPRRRRSSHLS